MVQRQFWLNRVEQGWAKHSVVWLSGVRRSGKTFLCQSIPSIEYFDCELPRIRRLMEDPEPFLQSLRGKKAALDEIHRLSNPSQILKIAADHYPDVRIVATGSSTLGASIKFKDTLAGRKKDLRLTPMILNDLKDFKKANLKHRFLRGGLPPFLLAPEFPEKDFQEWVDAYWAKDIQELFRLERRHSFQKFFELLMAQSGGIFEANRFAQPCEASRTTIANYLRALEATYIVSVIRPFSARPAAEIISAPKIYAFDTGFVCYYRGWNDLRLEDLGLLWEHFVLNELQAQIEQCPIKYWRDKRGHELDFVILKRGKAPIAVECKWSSGHFDAANLVLFRNHYPEGENFVVCHDIERMFSRRYNGFTVQFVSLPMLVDFLRSEIKP